MTFPKLNGRYLLCLLGGLTVLAGGLYFLHRSQLKRNASALLSQSKRAEQQGRLDRAVKYLDRYVQLASHDLDALQRYGLLLDRVTAPPNPKGRLAALLTLERLIQKQPERHDVRRELVRIAMAPDLQRYSDARHHLEKLLDKEPNSAELEFLLGQCLERMKDYEKAAKWFGKTIEHQFGHIEAYSRLAAILRHHRSDPDKANKLMDEAVQKNTEPVEAYLLRVPVMASLCYLITKDAKPLEAYLARAQYCKEAAMLQQAAEDLEQARELAPDDDTVLLQSAEVARATGEIKEARGYLARGLKKHRPEARLYIALAALEVQTHRPSEALASLRRGLTALPNHPELLWSLADLLLQRGERAEPRKIIDQQLRRQQFPAALLDYLEARFELAKGDAPAAAAILERIQPALQPWPDAAREADLLLGHCCEQIGDADRQHNAYRRVVAADRLSVPGCLGLGSALVKLGKVDEALVVYERIASKVPASRLMKARLLILTNLRRPPAERQWDSVATLLDEHVKDMQEKGMPADSAVPILRAEILAGQDKLDEAYTLLAAEKDRRPRDLQLWVALAGLKDRQGKPDDALALLDEADKRLDEGVELRLARARHWGQRGGRAARAALARLEGEAGKLSPADRERLLRGLAQAYAEAGAAKEAYRLWEQLAREHPDDLHLMLILFDRARQTGDEPGMERLTQEMYRVERADGTLWRYGRVCLLLGKARLGDKAALTEARPLLDTVVARRPAWSRPRLCEAQLLELAGDAAAAVPSYLRAIDLGEQDLRVIERVVGLLYARQRFAEADQVIRKLPEQAPLSAGLQRLASEVSLRTASGPQDYRRALERARKAVPADTKDYRQLIWLGQMEWAGGHVKEADAALRKAVAVAETEPAPWVALVAHLVRTDRRTEAEQTTDEAHRKIKGPHALLARAQCEEIAGRTERATKLYGKAELARPEDTTTLAGVAGFHLRQGQRDEAGKKLRKIIDLSAKAPEQAAWARRTLAVLLAAGGDAGRALELLGLSDGTERLTAGKKVSPQDKRTRAVILAAQKDKQSRREAIRLLKELFAKQPPTAEDQFFLAQLYEAVDDWINARLWLGKLAPGQADNPAFLEHYARALLRHGELDEAKRQVELLKKREPRSFRSAELSARLLAALGQTEEAARALREYARGEGARPELAAAVLEQLKQTEAAGELYEALAKQPGPPEKALPLAGYLGRRGKVREALDLCEAVWKETRTPEAVAQTCLVVLHAGSDDAQRGRVAGWLEGAARKHPDRPVLLAYQADLSNLRGRYGEAARFYEKLLERAPQGVGTLNNLAWLLALHEGKTAAALDLIGRAIELEGAAPAYLLDTRGTIYLKSGATDRALNDLQKAVAEAPTATRYFHLARAHFQARDRRAATRALERARGMGLTPDRLHPLERPAYAELVAGLAPQ